MRLVTWMAPLSLLALLACERVVGVDNLKIVRPIEGAAGAGGSGQAGGPTCSADGQDDCSSCIVQKCCSSALACSEDPSCASCLGSSTPPGCDTNGQKYGEYLACAQGNCPACLGP